MISLPYTDIWAIDPLQDDRWSELIAQHPNAAVFHTRGWLRALQTTYGYKPVAFTTSPPSQELKNAILFCAVRSWLTGSRLVSLPFSDHCEPLVENPEHFRRLSFFAESLMIEGRWKYVEIRSANSLLGFSDRFGRATTYYLHRLDLRPSLDELYKGFHKDCIRRKISRAERESLTYETGRNESLIQQLYSLLQLTRSRHHVPPQPFEWFRNLVTSVGGDLCIRVASKAGRPVAGILTISHGKKMIYKYGGSDAQFNNLGGMPMLLWKAIQEGKQAGVEELDLGRSDRDNTGLIAFKEHWSAEPVPLSYWRYPETAKSTLTEGWKARYAKQLLTRLPNSVVSLAGNLLYRHIG